MPARIADANWTLPSAGSPQQLLPPRRQARKETRALTLFLSRARSSPPILFLRHLCLAEKPIHKAKKTLPSSVARFRRNTVIPATCPCSQRGFLSELPQNYQGIPFIHSVPATIPIAIRRESRFRPLSTLVIRHLPPVASSSLLWMTETPWARNPVRWFDNCPKFAATPLQIAAYSATNEPNLYLVRSTSIDRLRQGLRASW